MLFQHKRAKSRTIQQQRLSKQRGVVIVVALFVVALTAIMAYTMMARLERDTWRTGLILRTSEAYLNAQGSIAWAQDQLRTDWEKQKKDKLIDPIPIRSGIAEVNGYKIQSTIYDMQSRFNLNNLSTSEGQEAFLRLLKAVAPQTDEQLRHEMTQAIADWVTASAEENEFTKYYLSLPTPYRSAHRTTIDVNELRLVKGMTPKIFSQVRPYVTSLPSNNSRINIQTAPAPVLTTLSSRVTMDAAKEIEKARAGAPIISMDQFANTEVAVKYGINSQTPVVVVSDYFLVETDVAIAKQHVVLYTLLERTLNGVQPTITTLWQSKGTW